MSENSNILTSFEEISQKLANNVIVNFTLIPNVSILTLIDRDNKSYHLVAKYDPATRQISPPSDEFISFTEVQQKQIINYTVNCSDQNVSILSCCCKL